MTHPQTAADLRGMIDDLDAEMSKLRALLRQGEAIRAELVKGLAALAWEEGNDPSIVRIVRNDP